MKRLYTLVAFCILSIVLSYSQTCLDSGTGVDGAYHATNDTTLAGGTYNFTTFTIDGGVTVTVTGMQPLIVLCTGAVNISGTLSAAGANGTDGITYSSGGIGGIGVAGGAAGGNGIYASTSGPLDGMAGLGTGGTNNQGNGWSGGGGGGYATTGQSSGGVGGVGGPIYGDTNISGMETGSGGGGGSGGYECGAGGGGAGGGIISITSISSINILPTGVINCNGGNGGSDGGGNCGGGGGGSGGSIILKSLSILNDGVITCMGGIGGASSIPGAPYFGTGGNGSIGRIRLDYNGSLGGTGTINPTVGAVNPVTGLPNIGSTVTLNDTICSGDSITLSGTGGVSYVWSAGVTNNIPFAPLTSASYTVTGTDIDGCTNTNTISITVNSLPAVNLGADILQPTTPAILDAGTGFSSYLWSTTETTQTISVNTNGAYIVTVTNTNGCENSDTIQVTFTTGIAETTNATFTLYPVPSNGYLQLIANHLSEEKVIFNIMDISGKIVYHELIQTSSMELIKSFDLNYLNSGVYIISIESNTIKKQLQFIISK